MGKGERANQVRQAYRIVPRDKKEKIFSSSSSTTTTTAGGSSSSIYTVIRVQKRCTYKSVYQTKCVRHLLLLLLAKGRALYYTHSLVSLFPLLNIASTAAAVAATHNGIRMRSSSSSGVLT
jgi:hypothetical protein